MSTAVFWFALGCVFGKLLLLWHRKKTLDTVES